MRLWKCLYGLKQAPREWNHYLDAILKKMGFIRVQTDFGIYMKGEDEGAVFIAVYVDDSLLVGRRLDRIKVVKAGLHSEFNWAMVHSTDQCSGQPRTNLYFDKTCLKSKGLNCTHKNSRHGWMRK